MTQVKIRLNELQKSAETKGQTYYDEVVSKAYKTDDTFVYLQPDVYLELRKKYSPSIPTQISNVISSVATATKSIVKTSLGIDVVDDQEFNRRLNICRQCPGSHAIFKNGNLHTCGKMLESARNKGERTCGCVLNQKAKDKSQHCPNDYW